MRALLIAVAHVARHGDESNYGSTVRPSHCFSSLGSAGQLLRQDASRRMGDERLTFKCKKNGCLGVLNVGSPDAEQWQAIQQCPECGTRWQAFGRGEAIDRVVKAADQPDRPADVFVTPDDDDGSARGGYREQRG